MSANEVVSMIGEALRAMSIGVPGVFLVLAVFYVVIKLTMSRGVNGESDSREQE